MRTGLRCPHCRRDLFVTPDNAGRESPCIHCGSPVQMPAALANSQSAAKSDSRTYRGVARGRGLPDAVAVPILVSGISNVVFGIIWTLATLSVVVCFGFLIGVPMVCMGIFELMTYANRRSYRGSAKPIGVFEIIVGLFNWVSFVCGILVLVHDDR